MYIASSSGVGVNVTATDIASVNVPAGGYFITAKLIMVNNDGSSQNADCNLSTGDDVELNLPGVGAAVYVLHDSATFGSTTTITLTCATFFGTVFNAKLAALAVGGVN